MLQDIRKNAQGTVSKIIIGLIVVAFAFFGIESILLGGGDNSIAEINGEGIGEFELQQAINNQKRSLLSMMGESVDPAMLDDERIRPMAMESLIQRTLLQQAADELSLGVSEREIGSMVASMEAFQENGAFSSDLYRVTLANAGYTPALFKASLHDDLLVAQIGTGLAGTEFVTPTELAANVAVITEQRDLRYLTIPREGFATSQVPAEEDIQAWYEENSGEYMTEETVDLEYIELTLDDFRQPVDDAAIEEAFEMTLATADYGARSRVSHILFTGDGELSMEEGVARAQEELNAGTSFADVAAALSEDAGSAGAGGDLGYTTGDAFPEEMEAAISELEIGIVSKPVRTDAGTHLILVTERTESEPPVLDDELRAQLTEQLQLQEARAELLLAVEDLKDLAFNAEDLNGPAAELGLTVQQIEGVSRFAGEGVFEQQALRAAAFSDDVLNTGHNSDVIELRGETFVALRVLEHHEPQLRPLEEVRDSIAAALVEEATRTALANEAQRLLSALRGGTAIDALAAETGYAWQVEIGAQRRNLTMPPEVLGRAFELPVPEEGSSVSDITFTSTGDAVIVELFRVTPGTIDTLRPEERSQLAAGLARQAGGLLNTELQSAIRARADVVVR
ncbi:MAG: peptidylprolyl isomerase [Halioglobus sp.]|nr:peptidylprolyl isomerase [Halioglobus sp.]